MNEVGNMVPIRREFVQRRVAEISHAILDKADELKKIAGPKKQRKNPGF